ncbi:MAG: Fe-S cluster protein [Deltaproteobacteria bacterium RIFOXYD12_FULL_57_12]|nr:MAG: Fe-S cluster protein [Deltaproteobacteria bacterium RIFOXYD12_FULL_57_12]
MLLKGWTKEISRAACRPEAQTVHCIAHLDQPIGAAIPYLNAVLGGYTYIREPPSVTIRAHGKLITVHADRIAINALRDAEEAEKILTWLQGEINNAWEKQHEIEPMYQAAPQPQVFQILKLLPRNNCGKCGLATCMVFAALAAEGGKKAGQCPELDSAGQEKLNAYLGQFRFDW